jgi:hypothetical protein
MDEAQGHELSEAVGALLDIAQQANNIQTLQSEIEE